MQAIDALRRAITTGELAPGTHVSEVEMAERLGISRGTLREAMRTLQIEGLLTDGPRGRLLVRHMSPPELEHLFEVRAALEALAGRTLSARSDRGGFIEPLRVLAQRIAASDGTSIEQRMAADLDFHRELCRLTGNDTLLRAWTALEGSIQLSIMHSGTDRAVRNMNADRHLELVAAIEAGDPEETARKIHEHMAAAVQVLIS